MAVAEIEPQGVVTDAIPAQDGDSGKVAGTVATVAVTEDVALAKVGGAGGCGAKFLEEIV